MLGNIFQEARKKAFPSKRSNFRGTNYHTKNKPWFGPQCKTARKKYHLAKKRYNQIKSPAGKNNLIYYSKEYKKTMDKFISKYRKDTEKKS